MNGSNYYVNTRGINATITLKGISKSGENYYKTLSDVSQCTFNNLEDGNYTLCINKKNYKPIIINNIQNDLYVQNIVLNGVNTISASNIYVGNDVNESEEKGDVIIDSGVIVFDASNSVCIKNGFTRRK